MSAGSSGYSSTLFSVFNRAQITSPERYLLRPFLGVPSMFRQLEGESPFDNLMEVKS